MGKLDPGTVVMGGLTVLLVDILIISVTVAHMLWLA